MTKRRQPVSVRRQLLRQLVWMAIVFAAFYLFVTFEVYRWIGEWVASFWNPGG